MLNTMMEKENNDLKKEVKILVKLLILSSVLGFNMMNLLAILNLKWVKLYMIKEL